MRNYLIMLAGAAAFAAASAGALAQDEDRRAPAGKDEFKTVTVTGTGADEDAAMRDARRKAVEEGAGTEIMSKTKVENLALVKDTVIARATGWIQKTDILSPAKQMEDGTWEVRIKAVVSTKIIDDVWATVKQLLQDKGRPKIMVWVNEKIDGEVQDDSTVQAKIEGLLLESGFLLVDRDRVKQLMAQEKDVAAIEDKPDKIIALMKQEEADVFITGTANATAGRREDLGGVDVHTYEAEAIIKVYNGDTGLMMAKISPEHSSRGVQRVSRSAAKQALDLQGRAIAPKVQADIVRSWMDCLGGMGELKLTVENVPFKQHLEIRDAIKKIKDIKDVTAKFNKTLTTYSIQSSLRAENVAEELAKTMDKTLDIEDVTGNTIKAKYKPE